MGKYTRKGLKDAGRRSPICISFKAKDRGVERIDLQCLINLLQTWTSILPHSRTAAQLAVCYLIYLAHISRFLIFSFMGRGTMSLRLSMYLEYTLDTTHSSQARAVHISSIWHGLEQRLLRNKSQVAYAILNRKTETLKTSGEWGKGEGGVR